ncbi:MAG: lysophospholipid acyltransferase family protein [Anaerolineales bacterium]|jgi:KDO2-lipid IV(A) lauroyltransferase
MQLEEFTSSRLVTQTGLTLAQHLPPRAGYAVARLAARLIASRRPRLYFTVQQNLRQVMGETVDQAALETLTYRTFLHAGRSYYDFFHALRQSPAQLAGITPIPAEILTEVHTATRRGRGVLFLGMHLSNFDLVILSIGSQGLPIQALSMADPQAGAHVLNQVRATAGLEITPITPASLRQSIRRLKRGGIAMTAIDFPDPDDRMLVPMFGRDAYLPLGPARLALLTDAAVFLGACHHTSEAGYQLEVIGPLEMTNSGDRQADIYTNTCRFAAFMEAQIRRFPEQWMMFHPFWPPVEPLASPASLDLQHEFDR